MCRMTKRRNRRWTRNPTARVSACTEESTVNDQQVSVAWVTVSRVNECKMYYIGNEWCSSAVTK